MEDSDPLAASSVRVFCARNSKLKGRSLPLEGRVPLFQWDVGISVGFSTEFTCSLRNPGTRRTPSMLKAHYIAKVYIWCVGSGEPG